MSFQVAGLLKEPSDPSPYPSLRLAVTQIPFPSHYRLNDTGMVFLGSVSHSCKLIKYTHQVNKMQ